MVSACPRFPQTQAHADVATGPCDLQAPNLSSMGMLLESKGKVKNALKTKQNKQTNKNAENYSYREMNRLSFRQPSVNTTNIPMNYTFKMSSHYC
jgi:hypothetical protein